MILSREVYKGQRERVLHEARHTMLKAAFVRRGGFCRRAVVSGGAGICRGVEKNDKKAAEWYQKAAERGDKDAEKAVKRLSP